MTNQRALVIVVALLVVAGVAGVLWRKGPAPAETISLAIDPLASTTASSSTAPYSVEYYPIPQDAGNTVSAKAPSLSRKVMYSSALSPEVRRILGENIAALRGALSKNALDFGSWMNLAIQYKTASDYEGAREIWEYVSQIYPEDAVALHNLGDIYHHFLNDFARAESYYKSAIARDGTQGVNYLALHDLYRYSYKQDTTAAVDILKKGVDRVSGNQAIDLYSTLGSYYQDKGDIANAIVYYTKARDGAQKAGNTALVAELDATLSGLRK